MADDVVCQWLNNDTVVCNGIRYTREELLKDTSVMFWVYLCVYIALVLFAGENMCQTVCLVKR